MSHSEADEDPDDALARQADDDRADPGRPRLLVPALLLGATFVSTMVSGAMNSDATAPAKTFGEAAWLAIQNAHVGLPFALAIMSILIAHEAGHAIAARAHGVPASLPYFLPLPFTLVGTAGAVIGLRGEVRSRNALVDIAAAGPLAGLAVAIPVLLYGLHLSSVGPTKSGDLMEGQSLLYLALKYLMKGELLPSGGRDVQLSPVALAGWVGLLLTAINLIPIGPLDGGHLAAAAGGPGHDRRSRVVHWILPFVGLVVALWFGVEAVRAGAGARALGLGVQAGLPWLLWSGLLLLLRRYSGGRWREPLGREPLTRGRRVVLGVVAVMFVAVVMPWVMRELP